MKTRLVQLKEAAEAAAKSARGIAEKAAAENRDMTETERKDFDDALAKGSELVEKFKTAKADEDVINAALSLAGDIGPDAKGDLESQDGQTLPPRERAKSLGLQIVESTQFKSAMEQFKDGRIPEGSRVHTSPIQVKGLFVGGADTSAGAFVVNEQTGIIEPLGRKELKIRDLVSVRRTGSDTVEYVAQTSHTNAAAVVPEATSSAPPTTGSALSGPLINNPNGGYKPEGAWAYERKTAVVKTIAEWVPATKRALADVAALEGLINDELRLDVAEAEEGQILNGNGSGENFTGINNWSGVQTQAFSTDLFESVRKAITKARTVGRVNPTAIVVNPSDAEVIDLAKDLNGVYRYGGPQVIGQRTLWGLPVVESETQGAGEALLGDFSKAVVWDREQTTVTMTDSHADFFIRNLVAILAEERLAFAVTRPTAFVKVDIAA
ncbi:phage major capsid protein [Williamsia sp. D3]|uniref:phage major capsid protein n=1 Tax=Williamsia sp. D3 TaxID=1313067 RepID=UPI0003D2B377|nr:phage major capsid protein [Williamsia sp. D3]ETD31253.1 head protein [Williamsia sp. D3]